MRLLRPLCVALALSACGPDASTPYHFTDAVTACERLEWAREHAALLEEGDTVQARQYASTRCFLVEPDRPVLVLASEGGAPWGIGAWVEVRSADDGALEHLASAELRRTLGQEVRRRGWVAGEALEEGR